MVSSNHSSVFLIFISVLDSQSNNGENENNTPALAPTQVTTAAKRPNRTKKFLADISAVLDVFDDEISSVGDCRATAYETFISSYKTAFAHIWPKIKTADVKIVLQSIKDKELNELRCMSQMMSSDSSKPALIKENRPVPALENILGSMVIGFRTRNYWTRIHAH